MSEPKIEELSYEQAFEQLQTLIEALESGEKPLEETLALYERGQALYQRCLELARDDWPANWASRRR